MEGEIPVTMELYETERENLESIGLLVWIDHLLLIHSSVDGHVRCFHFEALIGRAMMSFYVTFV